MSKYIVTLLVLAIVGSAGFVYFHNKPQVPQKMYHVGVLVRGSGYETGVEGYKVRMTELGYVEGKDITYDVRYVSDQNKLPKVIKEFVQNGVDVIHTYSTPATIAAYEETKNLPHPIPVVFGSVGDALILGSVASIQHPGANVTGVTSLTVELTAKRLELLRQINPAIKKVAMPHNDVSAGDLATNKSVVLAEQTAAQLGINMVMYPVKTKKDNPIVAAQILHKDADAMIVGGDSLVWGDIDLYIAQAIKEKLPFIVASLEQTQKGGLVAVGPDFAASGKQAANITNKIFRGSNPADIPIEVPEKLIFAVNLDTAKKIGLTLSPTFLKQADVVIGKN